MFAWKACTISRASHKVPDPFLSTYIGYYYNTLAQDVYSYCKVSKVMTLVTFGFSRLLLWLLLDGHYFQLRCVSKNMYPACTVQS